MNTFFHDAPNFFAPSVHIAAEMGGKLGFFLPDCSSEGADEQHGSDD